MSALAVRAESWPTRGTWTISRGSVTAVDLVVVELKDGDLVGRGECRPYGRYGETVEGVIAEIESLRGDLAGGLDLKALQELVKRNLKFVVSVANKYKGYRLSLQDLIEEGNLGLLRALCRQAQSGSAHPFWYRGQRCRL